MFERIGFIGTGLMGAGMAKTLARKGYHVTAYNRTRSRAEALVPEGVAVAPDPAAAVSAADAVVCMLPHVGTLAALLDTGLAAALRPGTYLIDCSTAAPVDSRATALRLREAHVTMLDAPVFGSKDSAETGELTFVVGGDRGAFEACQPLFDAMGRRTFYVGGNGYGCYAKLGFNLVIAGTTQAFAETLALTGSAGVDPQLMVDIIMAGRARSGIIEMKAPPMLARDFTPFFALKHMQKDLALMIRTARDLNMTLPMTAAISAVYDAAVARGLGELDFSAILQMLDRFGSQPQSLEPAK
jgi:3-hydroxyisobutyrate dehydrogenase-like beta-hydroxyacid dehydrogenase